MTAKPCPRCTYPMTPNLHAGTELDHCHRCGGSFLHPATAAGAFGPNADPAFWKQSHITSAPRRSRLTCPRCRERLDEYIIEFEGARLEIDECARCHGLWLDRNEGPHLANLIHWGEDLAQRKRDGVDRPGVVSYLFQMFTLFPIEVWNPVRRRPYLLIFLMVCLVGLFVWELNAFAWMDQNYSLLFMVPADIVRGEHLWTVLTAAFMHASWPHLLGNLYFMWVFGDNIEDTLGVRQFLLLFVVTAIAGNLAHAATDLQSMQPLVGASGAISGLMGAYLALFPRVKVWIVLLVIRFRLSVIWYLGAWIGLQILMSRISDAPVAWFAHLGGFACGLAWGLVARRGRPQTSR